MSLPTCPVCGDVLDNREAHLTICLLCQVRTSPADLAAADRRQLGLLDSA